MSFKTLKAKVTVSNDELTVNSVGSAENMLEATVGFDKVFTSGGEGTFDHSRLHSRNIPDQHPIVSITGLTGELSNRVKQMEYFLAIYSLPPVNWYIHHTGELVNGTKDSVDDFIGLRTPLIQGVEVLGFEFYLPVPMDADIAVYNTQGCHIHFEQVNPNWTYRVRFETWAFDNDGVTPFKIYDYTYDKDFRAVYGSYITESVMNGMLSTTSPKRAVQGQVVLHKVFVTAIAPIGPTPGIPTLAIETGGDVDSKFTRNFTGCWSANSLHAINSSGQPTNQGRINYDVQTQLDGLTKKVYASEAEKNADPNWRNYDFAMVKE